MNDWLAWLIIAGFYAPLHFLMPALVLFVTGSEPDDVRRRLIRRALIDSLVSMVLAFLVVLVMANAGLIFPAMVILFLSMLYPFLGIWRHRREITMPDVSIGRDPR
jgi:hypothetical protein